MSESYTWGDYYSNVGRRDNEEARLNTLQDQKSRLIAARTTLEENKDYFETARKNYKEEVYDYPNRQWKGSNYDSCNSLLYCIKDDYGNCSRYIDDLNDDLNWKIANVDLEIDACQGNISVLNYAINRIWTFLCNVTN